ncbi:MAG TPA: hypothetical protein VGH28_06905 [Polyangiaceae bacterium]|jgi:hypothetical protein
MLEIALCAVAAVLALGGAALAARLAGDGAGVPTARAVRLVRDDAIVGAAASAAIFVLVIVGRRSISAAAWGAGACAAGALAAIAARAWRERASASSPGAGAVGEQVVVTSALVLLAVVAAASSHTLGDPQRLASRLPDLVVSFALGCGAVAIGAEGSEASTAGERALPSVAAMVLAAYFFDANAGSLRSARSYASALGIVLFPLAASALGALGAAVATLFHRPGVRSRDVASVLALPAAAGAALALLGWLWEPFALCAAVGAAMTLVPKLVRPESRGREAAALAALGAAAIGSYAVAQHAGLAHAGPLGLGVAAVAAESASLLDRADPSDESAALADRQAAALAAIAVALAVLDGAVFAKCMHFAEAAHAPTADTATMLEHCTVARVAPARIDLSQPATIVAALAGLAACIVVRPGHSLRSRVIATASIVCGVAIAAAALHVAFGLGAPSLAAAALASSLAAALFPSACSRPVAALIAAAGLALGAATV